MKKRSDNEIDAALKAQRTDTPIREKEEFWSDFSARASLRTRELPRTPPLPFPTILRWAATAACVIIAIGWFGVRMIQPGAGGDPSRIESVEVMATHSAVMIIDDEPTESVILWVVDMEENGGGA